MGNFASTSRLPRDTDNRGTLDVGSHTDHAHQTLRKSTSLGLAFSPRRLTEVPDTLACSGTLRLIL